MNYLVGDKIKLIKFEKKHITEEYISWLNDHELTRFLNTGRTPVSENEIDVPSGSDGFRLAIMADEEKKSTFGRSKIIKHAKYIGTISLHKIDWVSSHGEIGYLIGNKDYWGKGIATEAVKLISDYGFNRLNLHKIEAGVVVGNVGSIKALEKNGFRVYGRIPDDYYLEGKYLDTIRFYKLRSW